MIESQDSASVFVLGEKQGFCGDHNFTAVFEDEFQAEFIFVTFETDGSETVMKITTARQNYTQPITLHIIGGLYEYPEFKTEQTIKFEFGIPQPFERFRLNYEKLVELYPGESWSYTLPEQEYAYDYIAVNLKNAQSFVSY